MATRLKSALAGAMLLGAAAFIGGCTGPQSAALVHPEKLESAPVCTSCHDADYAVYNHDLRWMKSHGQAAVRNQRGCEICHQVSYCADCHGNREEIKPTDKRPDRFSPSTPHRGDYLSQHQVDGRLDPASCFTCHGRKNEGRCRICHQ